MAIVRWLITLVGWLFLGALIYIVVSETPFFLRQESRSFWRDARDYLLKNPSAKTLDELRAEYGDEVVRKRLVEPRFDVAYLPSEHAAFLNLLAYVNTRARETKDDSEISFVWMFVLICFYLPITVAARQTQRVVSGWLCRKGATRQKHAAYFARLKTGAWRSALAGLALTVLLCTAKALWIMSPAYELTLFDLISSLVVLSYLGGLWMRLVSYVVEVGLLVGGLDPDRSIHDEVIALIVVSPVLFFVYQNSLAMIVTSAAAGLASGLFRKWIIRKQRSSAGASRSSFNSTNF